MDDNIGVLVPLLVIGLPLVGWILGRIMKHRERMQMLRMGIIPPPDSKQWRRNGGSGPWAAGAPQGMPGPGFVPPGYAPPPPQGYGTYDDPNSAQCTMRAGIKTTMVGLALFIGFSFIGYHAGEVPPIRPGVWLLGGLIPMFVGIAQIIIAVMSGATFTMRPVTMPPPMPPGSPPPPGPRPYTNAAQPGQPGVHYEELARPVRPPDRI